MRCQQCRYEGISRDSRRGILEKRIFPLFGCFPWKCPACNKRAWLSGVQELCPCCLRIVFWRGTAVQLMQPIGQTKVTADHSNCQRFASLRNVTEELCLFFPIMWR
jgi:hypothetical protein